MKQEIAFLKEASESSASGSGKSGDGYELSRSGTKKGISPFTARQLFVRFAINASCRSFNHRSMRKEVALSFLQQIAAHKIDHLEHTGTEFLFDLPVIAFSEPTG